MGWGDRRRNIVFLERFNCPGESVEVRRWKVDKRGREVRWQWDKGGGVARWQGGRFLALFKGWKRRVTPRLHLFVPDVNQGIEGVRWVQYFFT